MSPTFYLSVGFCALLVLSVGGYTGLQLLRHSYQLHGNKRHE
jgi:hypothetical protein